MSTPCLADGWANRENLKHEKQIMLPTPTRADLFGVPLEELMGFDGEKGGLPRVVKDCIQYLRSTGGLRICNNVLVLMSSLGLQDEGLFRRSPNSVMLKQAQQAYDRGRVRLMTVCNSAHPPAYRSCRIPRNVRRCTLGRGAAQEILARFANASVS